LQCRHPWPLAKYGLLALLRKNLKSLELSCPRHAGGKAISCLLQRLPLLESASFATDLNTLHHYDDPPLDLEVGLEVVPLPNLIRLEMSMFGDARTYLLDKVTFPALTYLSATNNVDLSVFDRTAEQLVTLELQNGWDSYHLAFKKHFPELHNRLLQLRVQLPLIRMQQLSQQLFTCKQLRELTICITDDWKGETDRLVQIPSPELRTLESLQIAWCGGDDEGPVAIAPDSLSPMLSGLPQLRHVHLSEHLGRADLSDLALHYPTLSFTRGDEVNWISHKRDCSCVRCQPRLP